MTRSGARKAPGHAVAELGSAPSRAEPALAAGIVAAAALEQSSCTLV
jgi:hypothetical protein